MGENEYIINGVLENLPKSENPENRGYSIMLQKYFPFKTPNGNTDIGYGIDLDKHPELLQRANQGLTKNEVNDIIRGFLGKELTKVNRKLDNSFQVPYKVNPFLSFFNLLIK